MRSPQIKRLTQDLLDNVAEQARSSPRQRQNYNFHEPSEKVQRLLNILEPGTYVRPHRHLRPPEVNGFEFFLVIQGEVGIILFDENGKILHTERISANGATLGIELPEGIYHTLVALVSDSVILELKEGPYNPSTDKEFIESFPMEGTAASEQLVQSWQDYFMDVSKKASSF
ncbi:MAG TPA: WbuC family cupin fold metalloprotein [Coleofasciculaceae cyanobacterium]|jgi:cupin fold WbuC family metalloprotein